MGSHLARPIAKVYPKGKSVLVFFKHFQEIIRNIIFFCLEMYWKTFLILITVSILRASATLISSADSQPPTLPQTADVVYYNGTILTMNDKQKVANYLAVSEGKVIDVGRSQVAAGKWMRVGTKLVNLHGKTIMPGFIDAHAHFSLTAVRYAQGFDISPPPFGTVTSIPQLLANLKAFIVQNNISPGQVIAGAGYSDIDMQEKRHPTRFQLDSVSTVNPILLTHFSFHIAVANSLALEMVNYTDASSSIGGGIIDAFPNGTITGVCREHAVTALNNAFAKSFDKLTAEEIQQTANHYFSNGVTTAQDILFSETEPSVYFKLGDQLPIDINGYVFVSSPNLTSFNNILDNFPTQRFKVKGAKFILDGSIQGFTALLAKPYWVPQEKYSDDLSDYVYNNSRSCSTEACGQDNFPAPTLLRELFRYLYFNNLDIIAHCNGDLAAGNMIEAIDWAKEHMKHSTRTRATMIHAQTLRQDQLDSMAQLGIHPSFFPIHIYLWGDKHYQIFLGPERANRMNPVGSAAKRGLKYTIHNDSPVVVMGIFKGINTYLKGIDAAVNRKTINGRTLDDGTQKVSIYDALKGITINAAWQANEDGVKGSLQVGKIADLVILNKNPLSISPEQIDSLKVQGTVKNGKLVFGQYPLQDKAQFFSNYIQVE